MRIFNQISPFRPIASQNEIQKSFPILQKHDVFFGESSIIVPTKNDNQKDILSSARIYGGVTNPADHTPKKYRYLVTAYPTDYRTTFLPKPSDKRWNSEDTNWNAYSKYKIETRKNPFHLGNSSFPTSFSLVEPKKVFTFGPAGWIVDAPLANVIATLTEDIHFRNSASPEEIKEVTKHFPILSGDTILEKASSFIQNHIIIGPNTKNDKLKPTGAFGLLDAKTGLPVNGLRFVEFAEKAHEKGLPFVALIDDNPPKYQEDKITVLGKRLYVSLNGLRYALTNTRTPYHIKNSFLGSVRMTQEQLNKVCKFLMNNGYTQEQIQHIQDDFLKIKESTLKSEQSTQKQLDTVCNFLIKNGFLEKQIMQIQRDFWK